MGIGYAGFYVTNTPKWERPETETTATMLNLCRRLGLRFTLDCYHRNPGPDSIRMAAAMGPSFLGVLIDELTHVRLLYPEYTGPDPDPLLADPKRFRNLLDAHDRTVEGLIALREDLMASGAPQVIATEVWPSLLHAAARAGMIPCPKICKEFYSPVSLAVGLGAALQYERPLWVDVDMWHFASVPGHPPEEVRANLEFAYWMGADLVYLEGCGYNLYGGGQQGIPFSLVTQVDDSKYQLTPHGEMLREFCRTYVPKNPRPWSFRDVLPDVAIVRFDDTDVGQKAFGVDRLYGTPNFRSDEDMRAWLALWNVLTHGRTGSDGISWFKPSVPHPKADERYHKEITPSYLSDPAHSEHRFFVPLKGVVVFDHTVGYAKLKGVPLIVLTGKHVSPATVDAIRRCVREGSLCVAWGPLAVAAGLGQWTRGVRAIRYGKGQLVLTDDFEAPAAVRSYRRFLGRPDEIRYRFKGRTLVLKRVTDNTVRVIVEQRGQSKSR